MKSKLARILKDEYRFWEQKREENIWVAIFKTQKNEKAFYYNYAEKCKKKADFIKDVLTWIFILAYRRQNPKNNIQEKERFSMDLAESKIDDSLMKYEGF